MSILKSQMNIPIGSVKGGEGGKDWKDLAAEWMFGEELVRDFWV